MELCQNVWCTPPIIIQFCCCWLLFSAAAFFGITAAASAIILEENFQDHPYITLIDFSLHFLLKQKTSPSSADDYCQKTPAAAMQNENDHRVPPNGNISSKNALQSGGLVLRKKTVPPSLRWREKSHCRRAGSNFRSTQILNASKV